MTTVFIHTLLKTQAIAERIEKYARGDKRCDNGCETLAVYLRGRLKELGDYDYGADSPFTRQE